MDLLNEAFPEAKNASFHVELADGRVIQVDVPLPHKVTFQADGGRQFLPVEIDPYVCMAPLEIAEVVIRFEARLGGPPIAISTARRE